MGIPVISIGVPTVVDAATIVGDALENLRRTMKNGEKEWQLDAEGSLLPELHNMYVASKDIDAVIKRLSYTVSEGINMALELE